MMLLKGYTISGQRVDFSLSDCPIFISDMTIALAGVKMSQLLKVNTIVRGDEVTGIYEGDVVEDNGQLIGYVIYSQGFKMQDLTGEIKNIPQTEHILLKEGSSKTVKLVTKNESRTEVVFTYQGNRLTFATFVAKVGNNIATYGIDFPKKLVDPTQIKFWTGFIGEENNYLCFGDFYDDGVIELKDYFPVVRVSETEIKPLRRVRGK